MRWLLPLLGAYASGRLAEICLLILWEMAELSRFVGPPVTWVAFVVAFLAALVLLLMFMDNLIARVAVWTAAAPRCARRARAWRTFRDGVRPCSGGGRHRAYADTTRDARRAGLGARVVLLPYFRSASEAVESALSLACARLAAGTRRRER